MVEKRPAAPAELSSVPQTMFPFASVWSSCDVPEQLSPESVAVPDMARLVVVAFVPVAFANTNGPVIVVEAETRPVEKVRRVVVAFPGNGSAPPPLASVPQERTPAADALTSQDAVFKFETMSCEVEAVLVIVRLVVVAFVPVAFAKTKFPVRVVDARVVPVIEALVLKTTTPDPVSSERSDAKSAEVWSDDEARSPSEEVAVSVYPPLAFPTRSCP